MSPRLSVSLPHPLYAAFCDLARREGVSMNQLITTAVAEKLSALVTEEYLAERAARGDRRRYLEVLGRVADAPAEPYDTSEGD